MRKPRIDLLVSSSCNDCSTFIISKISFYSPSTTSQKINKSLETQSLKNFQNQVKKHYTQIFLITEKKKVIEILKRSHHFETKASALHHPTIWRSTYEIIC